LVSSIAFGQTSQNKSASAAVTNATTSLEASLEGIQISKNPPNGFSQEQWKNLNDTQKKLIIRAQALGPSPEWTNMTQKERAAILIKITEELQQHPSKPISNEEYLKKRTAGEVTERDLIFVKQIQAKSSQIYDLKKQYPNGGPEFEKEITQLEKEKKSLLKELGESTQKLH
jgi:hypothetical protein